MAQDFSNYINTYKGSSVLQQQFPNMNDYLALFGYQGSTPSSATTSTTTSTPSTSSGVQGIINQNINQFQQGGGGGGGGITTLDPYSRPQGTPLDPNSFLGRTIQGVKDFGTSVFDRFSGSKIGEGITEGATKFKNIAFTPMMALANMRNPLNPSAQNYNPALQSQIDMLEGMTGTKITGTSGNLKFTDDQMMIGRDPNSGLAKYGPGSVLSGQNVVSGFGTNDYIGQLDKYIEKMQTYATLSKFQQAKLDRAIAERKAAREKAEAEMKAREQSQADRARSRNPGVYARADALGFTDGKGGGFGSKSTGTNEAFGNKTGRGRTGYNKGGLATMFKLKG